MKAENLQSALCRHFCADIRIIETTRGVMVSSGIVRDQGDRIGFEVVRGDNGYHLCDDGAFLADLEASGLNFATGGRQQFLDGVLRTGDAFWDRDSLQIRTETYEGEPDAGRLIRFLTALIRAHDVRFWTKERIESTFKHDASAALMKSLKNVANVNEKSAIDEGLGDFPADLVIRPSSGGTNTAVYLVDTNDGLNEALTLWQEARLHNRGDVKVIAIVDDEKSGQLQRRKLRRMENRIDATTFWDPSDQKAVIERVCRVALPDAPRSLVG